MELDAILGELCALETQFDKEIKGKPIAPGRKPGEMGQREGVNMIFSCDSSKRT